MEDVAVLRSGCSPTMSWGGIYQLWRSPEPCWSKKMSQAFTNRTLKPHPIITTRATACLLSCFSQSCPTLCDPMDCSPPGSSVHGISQARILECVAISSSRASSQPRDRTCISSTGRWIFTTEAPRQIYLTCYLMLSHFILPFINKALKNREVR